MDRESGLLFLHMMRRTHPEVAIKEEEAPSRTRVSHQLFVLCHDIHLSFYCQAGFEKKDALTVTFRDCSIMLKISIPAAILGRMLRPKSLVDSGVDMLLSCRNIGHMHSDGHSVGDRNPDPIMLACQEPAEYQGRKGNLIDEYSIFDQLPESPRKMMENDLVDHAERGKYSVME
jgi:hypothetical protein